MVKSCKKETRPQPAAPAEPWSELYTILHALLERRHYLQPFVKEYCFIDDALNQYFARADILKIGPYLIKGFCKEEESLAALPPAVKARYLKKEKKWAVEIIKTEAK